MPNIVSYLKQTRQKPREDENEASQKKDLNTWTKYYRIYSKSNKMKKTILFATIALTIASFIGCKKDETTTSTPATCTFNKTNLVGTWKFDNVKDSTGADALSKVDNCIVGHSLIFTTDSVNSLCESKNEKYNITTTVNSKNYLTIGTSFYDLEVVAFDCKTLEINILVNRPSFYVGIAKYKFIKQ
jgi:hypothetical protein